MWEGVSFQFSCIPGNSFVQIGRFCNPNPKHYHTGRKIPIRRAVNQGLGDRNGFLMSDPATREPAAQNHTLVAQSVNGQKGAPQSLRCAPRTVGLLRRRQMVDSAHSLPVGCRGVQVSKGVECLIKRNFDPPVPLPGLAVGQSSNDASARRVIGVPGMNHQDAQEIVPPGSFFPMVDHVIHNLDGSIIQR